VFSLLCEVKNVLSVKEMRVGVEFVEMRDRFELG